MIIQSVGRAVSRMRLQGSISLRAGFLAMSGLLVSAGAAQAGFTTINAPTSASETAATIPNIFNHVYGGTFSFGGGNGLDLSNGSLTAVRIQDTIGGLGTDPGGTNPGTNGDQVWTGTPQQAVAKAVWAGNPQTFGYWPGASGGTFTSLFGVTGTETYSVTGSTTFPGGLPATFRWGSKTVTGPTSSLQTDNFSSTDHLVTYQVNGLGGGFNTYLLFLEDNGSTGTNSDFDFQDLVVQVQILPVPEPGAMMLFGGAGLFLLKRVRPTRRSGTATSPAAS